MRIRRWDHIFQGFGVWLVVLSATASAAHAGSAGDVTNGLKTETQATQVENLIGELLGANLATPDYMDHGGGLQSLSIQLAPEQSKRLSSLLEEGTGEKAAYTFLAAGQSLTPPTNPSALLHAALSNTQAGYNYWVVVVNLGPAVTRNTTYRLTGPGRVFNRTFPLFYRANSIWIYWYSAPAVGRPGFYHYVSTVAGAGTFTTHTWAVNP